MFKIDKLFEEDRENDPDFIIRHLSLYIHEVIPAIFAWIPLVLVSVVYIYLLRNIRINRFNPRISSR